MNRRARRSTSPATASALVRSKSFLHPVLHAKLRGDDWGGEPFRSLVSGGETTCIALPVDSSVILLVWILVRCGYGFELTDEGYYLIWISRLWDFDASFTQFGFIYHPLYRLVGGDVALLRRANIGILLGLGFFLSYALLWSMERADRAAKVIWPCSAVAVATTTLVLFSPWLPTPSYNSLTIQSLMVTATGAVLARRDRSAVGVFGWLLLGLGGAVTFMAKPPSALVLGGLIPLYLAIAGTLNAWSRDRDRDRCIGARLDHDRSRHRRICDHAIQADQMLGISLGIALAVFILPGWRELMTRELAALVFPPSASPGCLCRGHQHKYLGRRGQGRDVLAIGRLAVAAATGARHRE